MNKITILGRLGKDPEMKYTPGGQQVTNFSIASSRKYKSNGEQREDTEWFNVAAWGRQAEICNEYLQKGQQVYIEGRLTSRSYQTQSGETRFSMDVNLTEMQMVGNKSDNDRPADRQTSSGGGDYQPSGGGQYQDVDDLPF